MQRESSSADPRASETKPEQRIRAVLAQRISIELNGSSVQLGVVFIAHGLELAGLVHNSVSLILVVLCVCARMPDKTRTPSEDV